MSAAVLFMAGCASEFDDSAIWDELKDQANRIEKLEQLCARLNTNYEALQSIVNALDSRDYILSVTPIVENRIEVGYTITLAKGKPITIYHGFDGKEGVTPQMKIEDGYWYISYDGGKAWEKIGLATGEDGDSFIKDIRQDDENVYFALSDGTEIVIPKAAPLTISFDTEDLIAMPPNSSRDIHYTMESSSEDIQIEAIPSADIKVKVVQETSKRGYISVLTSGTIDKYSKVVVLVADGTRTIMHTLKFKAEAEPDRIEVQGSKDQTASSDGGTMTLYYLSNTKCEVLVQEGVDWVHVVSTKALQEHEIVLSVDPNEGSMARSANVVVRSDSGQSLTYTITQESKKIVSPDEQRQIEREALIDFYKATCGDNWINNTNWCSDRPVGEWYGVRCDNDGFVIQLILVENLLSGSIPATIGNLTNLKELNISANQLRGRIPSELSKIMDADRLSLEDNSLSGRIPAEVAAHPRWKVLWPSFIHRNGFDYSDGVIPAPEFSTKDIDGESFNSDEVYSEGDYTIFYEMAWWNGDATNHIADLKSIYDDLAAKGIDIIGFECNDRLMEDMIAGCKANNIPWKIITQTMFSSFYWGPFGFVVDDKTKEVVKVMANNDDINGGFMDYVYDIAGVYPDEILYESTDYSRDGVVTQLQKATKGAGIDLVLMGDAYTDRLIADGTYDRVMETAMNHFFSEEPYKTYREFFNVYQVYAVSPKEVIKEDFETAIGVYFEDGNIFGDANRALEYAQKALTYRQMDNAVILVIANSDKTSGSCNMFFPYGTDANRDYGCGVTVSYVPTCGNDYGFRGLILHEAGGHGFAKLADEYSNSEIRRIPQNYITRYENEAQYGWWKNADFTDDLSKIKWSKFINDSRYLAENLGAYEGGFTYWEGVWKPTYDSHMNSGIGTYNAYNAPSREAIYYRIHKLAYGDEWEYDYEEFVKYDEVNRKAATKSGVPVYLESPQEVVHTAPPVVYEYSWREAMFHGNLWNN